MSGNNVVEERVRVFVRCRPPDDEDDSIPPSSENETHRSTFLTPSELRDAERNDSCIEEASSEGWCVYRRSNEERKRFEFDGFFDGEVSQHDVYVRCARRVVGLVAAGHNGTILAYGQTGSGKTWTMRGEEKSDKGIVPRALEELFELQRKQRREVTVTFSLSYAQIYCEVLTDLLRSDMRDDPLTIRERPAHEGGGVFVEGLCRVPILSAAEALAALAAGDARRISAATCYNVNSSRSHAIAIVYVERVGEVGTVARRSSLTLVDLAGSERAGGLKYQRLEECKAINLSLAALGNCVAALAHKRPHVPFRDSKLTRLLQGSLGGSSVTSLIATVRPSHYAETKSTLEFASRAALVEVRAEPREVSVDYRKLYEECRADLDNYENKLAAAELKSGDLLSQADTQTEVVAKLRGQLDDLTRRLEASERRRHELSALDGRDVEAIEAMHAGWAREAAIADDRHAAEMAVTRAAFEARLKAYRSAAEIATVDCDKAEEDVTEERKAHLQTLVALRTANEQVRDHERIAAQRISELLVECNDRREAEAALNLQLEAAKTAAADSAKELDRRVAILEEAGQSKLRDLELNYVSRDQVKEMERLFNETVELLASRLSSLEQTRLEAIASGNARGNMSHAARDLLAHLEKRPFQPETISDDASESADDAIDGPLLSSLRQQLNRTSNKAVVAPLPPTRPLQQHAAKSRATNFAAPSALDRKYPASLPTKSTGPKRLGPVFY